LDFNDAVFLMLLNGIRIGHYTNFTHIGIFLSNIYLAVAQLPPQNKQNFIIIFHYFKNLY